MCGLPIPSNTCTTCMYNYLLVIQRIVEVMFVNSSVMKLLSEKIREFLNVDRFIYKLQLKCIGFAWGG